MSNIATAPGWRLIYDGIQVIALFESSGETETIHTIFEADTQAKCEAEIIRLGLIPLPVDLQ